MHKPELRIKLTFITGLKEVVLSELQKYPQVHIRKMKEDCAFLDFIKDFSQLEDLRSVMKVFLILEGPTLNPYFLSNHKSLLGDLVSAVMQRKRNQFHCFKLICAGSDSTEVRSIADYLQKTFNISEAEDAELKIHIVKNENVWECGVQATPRPLSVRDYKVRNMGGAMDPTVAFAVNTFCKCEKADSYLNIFSGSGTLLIEAGLTYPNFKKLVGFDHNKEHLSLSIQNIKKAGLIKRIKLKEADLFDQPQFGTFDVLTADPPFGMLLSKYENLEKLYGTFIDYCQEHLNPEGILAVYTSKEDLFMKSISRSSLRIVKKLQLKIITSANIYLYPSIFVCRSNNT